MRNYKDIPIWKDVSEADWNSWQWQVRNRIVNKEQLKQVIDLSPEEEEGVGQCLQTLRMAITPHYASLMDPNDTNCPIRSQAVPTAKELHRAKSDMADPLHEEVDSPTPGLTHRYPDRVLLLLTDQCSMYCRFCTRRRLAGATDKARTIKQIDACIEYIRKTPVVRDVVLSGGDALLVSDELLESVLQKLRAIPHVEIIRLGTRTPVVLPQRITPELCTMLKKYNPIFVNVHFNHPKELTDAAKAACERLADAGFPLGNQSVLLAGINDCPNVLKDLFQKLLKIRVRPYYLYQCDLSEGIEHFRTSVATGMEIIESLRGHTTGMAVPTYVVDAPGGGGKIPVMPQYLISQSDSQAILRNYQGNIFAYAQPPKHYTDPDDPCKLCGKAHLGISSEKCINGK